MVDLIPKEARKTGEGKGSVLVKKGCRIARWFVSSYSCFFPLFSHLSDCSIAIAVFSSCWSCSSNLSCGKPTPMLPEFRDLGALRKPLPAYPLYSHYVRNSTRRASKNNNRDGVLDKSTGKNQPDTAFEWKQGSSNETVTPMVQCDTPIQHYTSVFCPCSFSTSLVLPSFICFFLHFFRLSFFSPLWLCHPSFYLSSGWRCSSRLSGLFEFFVLALMWYARALRDTSACSSSRSFSTSSIEPSLLFRSNQFFHSAASTYHCSFPLFSRLSKCSITPTMLFILQVSHLLCFSVLKFFVGKQTNCHMVHDQRFLEAT